MSDLGLKFLAAALGQDGAKALRKAVEREPQLAEVLIPRTIVGWLNFTAEHDYEGQIPGIDNSYVQFQKSEDGYSGTISFEDGNYTFEKSNIYHLAASIAVAMDIKPSSLDPQVRDQILVKLGKSIDTLAKAQVLVKELRSPRALTPTRMTTHGAYHIEHSGAADRPYSVVHTKTGSPVQAGIASLKDAQPIADWHHGRYGGKFTPGLSKRDLDPNAGYKISSSHEDVGGGNFLTRVTAHAPNGQQVGTATFTHENNALRPGMVVVDEDHRRRGLATAMYNHASQQTSKPILHGHVQTDEGAAFRSTFGKVELPGKSHQPTAQQGPQAPTPPMKQPANSAAKPPAKPKMPTLAIGKSEAEQECSMCGGHQFENHKFRGCICFRELAKSITTTAYGDGYVLTFKPGIDADDVKALMKNFRSKHD